MTRCLNPYCDGHGWVRCDATGTTNAYATPACKVGPHPPADRCPCGGYWQVFENGTFCKDCDRRKVTPKYLAEVEREAQAIGGDR